MNLFLDYQKKIFNFLKILKKRKIIKIPNNLKNITIELPPKNQKGDISCNAAMVLAKINKTQPLEIAKILKENLLSHFSEFNSIDIGGPGFLNIRFNISFWKKQLTNVIQLNTTYGSNKTNKKKYNI